MAAPENTIWGDIVNDYGRIGIAYTTNITDDSVKVYPTFWFWSKYSVSDNHGNGLYFDELPTQGSASTLIGSTDIQTTVGTGSGWDVSNQIRLVPNHDFVNTCIRGTSETTRYLCASLADVDRVGATMYVSVPITIPALDMSQIRIYNGTTFDDYTMCIYNGANFEVYAPCIYNGTSWDRC
jgi:hypothetical protein